MTEVFGFSEKNQHKIHYPNVPSAQRAIPHEKNLTISAPPLPQDLEAEFEDCAGEDTMKEKITPCQRSREFPMYEFSEDEKEEKKKTTFNQPT